MSIPFFDMLSQTNLMVKMQHPPGVFGIVPRCSKCVLRLLKQNWTSLPPTETDPTRVKWIWLRFGRFSEPFPTKFRPHRSSCKAYQTLETLYNLCSIIVLIEGILRNYRAHEPFMSPEKGMSQGTPAEQVNSSQESPQRSQTIGHNIFKFASFHFVS